MKRQLILLLFGSIIAAVPYFVGAAGLVPCGGVGEPACESCHVVSLADNVIGWLVLILGTIAAIVIAYAGIKLVTSGGNQRAMEDAKSMITNIIIGYIIVLAGWLIIDYIMKVLVNEGTFGVWNEIECVAQPIPQKNDINVVSFGSYALTVSNPSGTFSPGSGMGSQSACTVSTTGACGVTALQSAGFGSLANDAARIAGAESGCNPNAESRTDTTSDGRTYSVGTWQINLSTNVLNCGGEVLDCPSAFRDTGTKNQFNVKVKQVVNEDLYKKCVAAAKVPACNNQIAAKLANDSGDMGDWACSAKKCGINTTRNKYCPL